MGNVTPYVLVGGRSSRMGRDKAFVPWGTSTLLQQVIQRLAPFGPAQLLSGDATDLDRTAQLAPFGTLLSDAAPHTGPLAGIVAALADLSTAWALIVPVDQPFLPTEVLQQWAEQVAGSHAKASWFVLPQGPEPLPLLLHRELTREIGRSYAMGQRRLLPAIEAAAAGNTLPWPVDRPEWFRNLNHPHDLDAIDPPSS